MNNLQNKILLMQTPGITVVILIAIKCPIRGQAHLMTHFAMQNLVASPDLDCTTMINGPLRRGDQYK